MPCRPRTSPARASLTPSTAGSLNQLCLGRYSGSTCRASSRPPRLSLIARQLPSSTMVMNSGSGSGVGLVPAAELTRRRQHQPVEAVARQGQPVGGIAHGREHGAAEQLDRHPVAVGAQLEVAGLRVAREIVDAQDRLALELAQIGQDLAVARIEEGERAAAEGAPAAADGDQPLHPVQQRARALLLRLDVDRLVAEDRVLDRRRRRAACGLAREKPPLRSGDHCIGVRTPSRSPR